MERTMKPVMQVDVKEFEENLFKISQEAEQVANLLHEEAKANGKVDDQGRLLDACCVGSVRMYLDGRTKLYRMFSHWPYNPSSFYFITVYGSSVHFNLRNLNNPMSYTITRAAYEIVAKRLREIYGWDIYNDVTID